VKNFGPNVNLGNIPPDEVIPLETLRSACAATPSRRSCLATPSLQLPDIESMQAEDVLRWAYGEFGDKLCLTCSWQKQSSVLVHMVSSSASTSRHRARHAALLPRDVRDARRARRALRLELITPHVITVAEQHKRRGRTSGSAIPTAAATSARSSRSSSARAVRRVDLRHPPRPVAEPRADREGAVVERYGVWKVPPARRLGREARLGVHHRQRDSVQPAARRRLPLDRLHPVHAADAPDEEERAGRWAGSDKLECGIHVDTPQGDE
jgi:phosphoadenosine phosphosulfate reductase